MTEKQEDEGEYEEQSRPGGQILGCVFAALAAGFIFLVLFIFMRSC